MQYYLEVFNWSISNRYQQPSISIKGEALVRIGGGPIFG